MKVKSLSRVQFFETPWTAAYQVPPSMGFSRQEYYMSSMKMQKDRTLKDEPPKVQNRQASKMLLGKKGEMHDDRDRVTGMHLQAKQQ